VEVDFDDEVAAFDNFNTQEELARCRNKRAIP
jgi:molybdopterin-guanine dinucleotide biosynthesis protein A